MLISNSKSPHSFMLNNFRTGQKRLIFRYFRKLNQGQWTKFIKGLSQDSKKSKSSQVLGNHTLKWAYFAYLTCFNKTVAKYLFISCQRSNLTDNQQKLTILGHVKQCWQNGIWFSGKSNTFTTGMTQQPDRIEPLQMSPKSPKMYIWIFASYIKRRICPWFGAPLYKCLKLSWRCTSKTCKTACTAHFARTARTVWNLMKVLKLSTSGRTNFLRANITFFNIWW